MTHGDAISELDVRVTRLGTVLEPNGSPAEAEGILNPAAARSRTGELLLYPRVVAAGNVSRIGLVRGIERGDAITFERIGYALEPEMPYELRTVPGGYGCEDPRVTFVPVLDAYVMAYTSFGPAGPRITFAISHDGYAWERIGLADFSRPGLPSGDDKDGVFFPEPVRSPSGEWSLAFYHRPMLHASTVNGHATVPRILSMAPEDRESTRIAYVPLEPVLADRRNLVHVSESALVLAPDGDWGMIKNGAGTPPVRIAEGWLSVYHGVDATLVDGERYKLRYSAGVMVHDAERPDRLLYHSREPIFVPEGDAECVGIVNNVVFPTGIDHRPGTGPRAFDVYYGMADARIGRARIDVGAAEYERSATESAA